MVAAVPAFELTIVLLQYKLSPTSQSHGGEDAYFFCADGSVALELLLTGGGWTKSFHNRRKSWEIGGHAGGANAPLEPKPTRRAAPDGRDHQDVWPALPGRDRDMKQEKPTTWWFSNTKAAKACCARQQSGGVQ